MELISKKVKKSIKETGSIYERPLSEVLKELSRIAKKQEFELSVWNILSALRGKDGEHESLLKSQTASRLRGFLGIRETFDDELYVLTVRRTPLDECERQMRDESLAKEDAHFRLHFMQAIEGIYKIYLYDLRTEKFFGD
jgi:hypothetical protein